MSVKSVKSKSQIMEFVNLNSFAIFGASSKKKKMGNEILKQMNARGLNIVPVHRTAGMLEGMKAYPDIASIPVKPEGVILVIPPEQTEKAVAEIHAAGIKNVWMQLGADSPKAIEYCEKNGMKVVYGNCMLMFIEGTQAIHRVHKFFWNLGSRP